MSATQEEECNGEWMSHWVADILVRCERQPLGEERTGMSATQKRARMSATQMDRALQEVVLGVELADLGVVLHGQCGLKHGRRLRVRTEV